VPRRGGGLSGRHVELPAVAREAERALITDHELRGEARGIGADDSRSRGRLALPEIDFQPRRPGGGIVAVGQERRLWLLSIPRNLCVAALACGERDRRVVGTRRHRKEPVLLLLAL